MKNNKFLVLCFIFLAGCGGEMPQAAKDSVVQSVDAKQYLGTWYEIARLDHSFERGLEQVTANYSLEKDGSIKVVNKGYNTEKKQWKEAIGKAKFVDVANADGSRTGRLKVSFFGPFYGPYNITSMGYEALNDWLKSRKKKKLGEPYEVYVGDPFDKNGKPLDPYRVQTDIIQPYK